MKNVCSVSPAKIFKRGNMMKKFLLPVFCLCFFSCPEIQAAEMTISAAASLTNAFNELAANFEREHPGLKVYTNYAASNPLLKQIMEGAPVDVFASADQKTMDQAEEARLIIPDTRKTFAINDLVVIVPAGNASPASLDALKDFSRIAIGDPASVPAGRYAEQFLKKTGLWKDLENKFIFANSVRQAREYVASGEVDCGFVYGTDAKQMGEKVEVAFIAQMETPVSYPVAVVTTGNNPRTGEEFISYLLSERGQKILNSYGFASPENSAAK